MNNNSDQPPPSYGFRTDFLPQQDPNLREPSRNIYPSTGDLPYPTDLPYPCQSNPLFNPGMNSSGVQLSYGTVGVAEIIDDDGDDDSSSSENCVDTNTFAQWLHLSSFGAVPHTAVRAGTDVDGAPIYVGRAPHNGDILPAKVIPDKNVAYVCYGGQEHAKDTYELLYQPVYMWEPASGGQVPPGAVEVGRTGDGEILYMGRTVYEGSQTPGKIQPSHGCLYIPFNGVEVSIPQYEVLVLRQ